MRGAKRLAECFALAKHSSEDYYRSGQTYFRSGYVAIYLSAFNAWFLRTYMANWENVESCVWCQIVGNLLIYVPFFPFVDTFHGLEFTNLKKKGFQVFTSKITDINIEARKRLEKIFCSFNKDKLFTLISVQSNRTHLLDIQSFLRPVSSKAYLWYSRLGK